MFKLIVILTALALAIAKPSLLPRIIGGSPVEQGQFPFIVSLQTLPAKKHFCGASIVNEFYLVSAAHCLQDESWWTMTVYVGSVYLDNGGTYYNIDSVVMHPDYDPWYTTNDVGVVKMANPIQFNDYVQPANLPINLTVSTGDEAVATGWGYLTCPNETHPNQLQYLTSNIVDSNDCSSALDYDVIEGQVCFGGINGHGLCYGDSGSPLVYIFNNKSYIIGAVSWGTPCGVGDPDVFTRISFYIPWIQKQTKNY